MGAQYPVRVALPDPAPLDSHGAGAAVRRAFTAPAPAPLKAATAVTGAMTLGPIAPIAQVLGSQNARVGIRDFIDGLLGNPKGGAKQDPKSFRPTTPIEDIPGSAAPAVAVAKGPADPRSAVASFVNGAFAHPVTMRQAVALAGMVPNAAQTKVPSFHDNALASLLDQSQQMAQEKINQAAQLGDQSAAQKMVEQARKEHYDRSAAAISAVNPLNSAVAALMGQQQGD